MSAHCDCNNSSRVLTRLEEAQKRVRSLPVGGDLESLIHEEAEEMKVVLAEELVAARREQAASSEADFSPSGVPRL